MNTIIEQMAEIEDTAEAIVKQAQEEKKMIEKEISGKREAFDQELQSDIRNKIAAIQAESNRNKELILAEQHEKNRTDIELLENEFGKHQKEYAANILRKIIEV